MSIATSDSITSLMKAMLTVQGEVDGVSKDATNPHFRNRYASLESVVDAIREPCQRAGLVVTQAPGAVDGNTIALTTMICHAESGEWMRSTIQLPLAKADPQGAGSALTYAERYSLMAVFNLPAVDDDAEEATRPARPAPERRPSPAAAAVPSRILSAALAAMRQNTTFEDLLTWHHDSREKLARLSPEDAAEFQRLYGEYQHQLDPANLLRAG